MEEADGAGPANNEPHEEADKRGQSCSDRGDTGGFGMKIDSAALRGLKEGPDTSGCGDRTLTNLARINITILPVDLKPINLAALTDETGNSSSTDLNADVEKQHFLPLTNTEEQQAVMDTAAGGNKTDLKNKDPDTLRDTLHQSRKLCFKSKGLTRSFQHNASIDHLSVSPQTNCDGQHNVLNTLSEHHNSVSKTTEDAGFLTSCHVLDGLDVSQASFTKKNNNTCYSCITASKPGTLSASSADMTMVNATDIIQNCEYRAELFRVGDYKENTNNVKRVGLDRVSSQESACEESQIGLTLPGEAHSTECNLNAEVIINGTKAVSVEDAISEPRTESSNSLNVEEEMVEISEDSQSLLEIFHASSGAVNAQDDLNYELQQGYRILNGFLLEKHRSLTTPFMNPVSKKDFGDYTSRIQEPMWFRRMEQKFVNREYETITDFVGDFRLMLENCYRYHGVDHWLSKQAQKLEMMLEQKLTLLSRPLRGKTTLAMTSKGRYGSEDEKGLVSTSTRRRTTPRNLGAIATGASESIMVQALRLEEQQRAKDERRQREQERKETEEATAKELEEWERSLLAQAYPQPMDALWEVPAIGHFLCLAQQALKLPEIIFYELERFLLLPRCSVFLAKVMTSLLSHPQQRPTLHRRPALSYRSWEAALRQSVQRWYVAVGQAEDQRACAEQLGLCPQFFRVLGEVSPLEEKPFHLLPFYQRVWLLKGLCDWVYETQKEVQDAVLSQPIHECRESILGYDGQENAYIHFPHFCGADLRIYCQSPSASPEFPLPIRVKRLQSEHTRQEQQAVFGGPSPESNVKRNKRMVQEDPGCGSDSGKGGENDTRQNHLGHTGVTQTREVTDKQYGGSSEGEGCGNGVSEGVRRIITEWGDRKGSASDEGSLSGDRDTIFTGEDSLKRIKMEGGDITAIKEERGCNMSPKREGSVKAQVPDSNLCTKWGVAVGEAERNCEAKCRESLPPCWENQEKPSSPGKIVGFGAPLSPGEIRIQDNGIPPSTHGPCRACGTLPANESHENKPHSCPAPSAMKRASPEHSAPESQTEGKAGRMRTKKKKKKKKKVKEAVSNEGKARPGRLRQNLAQCSRPDLQQTVVAKKAKHKKHKSGKKSESKKTTVKKRKPCLQLPFEPGFQLVCTNVEELRALIRKTEEELKEFENMRKKSGKWYFRRQAVKELHCTLVRLLNELLPWEPKLIKAFQRNRARLKKDFDDFKRHPDHDNFVREVWTGEEGDGNLGKDTSSTETNRPFDGAEKQEVLKKELKGMEDSRQQGLELPACRNRLLRSVCQEGLKLQPKNPKRRQSSSTDDELTPKKRTKLGTNEDHVAALAETPLSNLKPATEPPATETFKVLPVFTKGDKPIQALLAKNVGNKVTLISQLPVTSSQTSNKVAVVPREKTLTAGQAPAKNPLQMLYKMPDNSCVPFDLLGDRDSGSVKIAMQPVLDQKTGEKVLQKVVILPRNLLLHHKHLEMETKQNQPSTTPKKASPGSFFDSFGTVQLDDLSKIPVQQVAPLSEVPRTEPAGISPKPNYLGASSSKFAPGQSSAQTPSSSRAVTASVSAAETSKSSDSMQELKTVCIRDSQSILVTTRGGNTGIVKVQTNPDHSTPGSLPPSPIFTFPPGFKAFLVSKSATSSATASATTCSATTSPGSTHFAGSSISSLSQLPSIPFTRAMGNSVCQTQPQKNMGSGQVTLSKSTMSSATLATTTQALSGTLHSVINMAAGSVGAVSTESFGKTSMVVTQAPLAQYATKLLTKRALPQSEASSADRAPIQKVILVTSPSIVTPCGSASKFSPPALAAPFHTQKLMFISPTSATATQSLIGAPKTPEKVTAMDSSTNLHAAVPTFSQIRDVKIGLNIGQAIVNAAANNLQKVQAINLVPSLAARITEDPPNHGRQTNISAPGADAGVRTAVSSTTANATPNDFSSSVNPGPINNRKTVSVSTVKAGHLASSVLVAASPQQCVSSVSSPVPTMGSPKAVQGRSSHLKTSPVPYTSSLPQKDVTDGNIQLLRTSVSSQAVGHPISLATLCTASFPVCAISTPFSQSQSQVPRNVSKPTQIFNTPVPAPRAVAQSTTVNLLSESSVQQKIVINTSTPLAPGTQIMINNSRLIVPPQGLGPGSHVLLISSPGMSPTGSVTGGPLNQKAIPVPSGQVCLTGNQNPRSLPTTSAQTSNALNKSQPPSTVKLTLHSAKTHALPLATASSNLVMAVGKPLTLPIGINPLPTGNAISAAQVSHLMAAKKIATPATQQSLRERAQTVTTLAEGKGLPIAAVQAVGNFIKGPVIATAPSVASSVNSTKTALAHGTLANMITKAQLSPLTPTLQPIGVSRPQTLPTATVPPIGSTISRIQTLPIATVPPIGSAITQTQASPIASVTPSDHPVIMAPAQPLTATTLNPIRTPVPFTNPAIMLSKQLQPASCLSLLTNSSSSKLIVSPEGAILNAISTPVPSFVKLSKPVATVVVTPSSSAGRMLPVFKVEDPSPHSGDPDKSGLT
ncbi:uncharacterized protein KIAA2026-like [Acipenser ruthenus]|uniref:uncharacterized protein KIAA2026-like n=1 Tax=Acipenser ruthenus TaxID=7906 RepID=UPI002741902C|nr:uncharacterized protein KIAA2026-like [Acipenser ruthenus]